jgi:tight adherence protein C
MLDLLVASVEAGLSLDAAVSRVAEELDRRYPTCPNT